MSSSLGTVGLETLSSNTDEASEEFRASLHFKGLNSVATTTLKAEDFGKAGTLKAYWGVSYDGGSRYRIEACKEDVSAEPENLNELTKSTVFFDGRKTSTIEAKQVKMYSISQLELPNIQKGIMFLDGQPEEDTKQYFMKGKCDPNERCFSRRASYSYYDELGGF